MHEDYYACELRKYLVYGQFDHFGQIEENVSSVIFF